jgi:hypothetical protein
MVAEAITTELAKPPAVWHRLPAAVRAGSVAMVWASGWCGGKDQGRGSP